MALNPITDTPSLLERSLLKSLVATSKLDYEEKNSLYKEIEGCSDYKHFERLQYFLEEQQPGINEIANPNQTDLNKHLKKFIH